MKRGVIRLLLRMYPARWRREYGEEFAEFLERGPVGVGVIVNVVRSAAGEWLRGDGMDYAASYDRTTKIVSGVVVVTLAAAPLFAPGAGWWLAAFSALVIGLSYAYSPRGYSVGDGEFRVKRLAGDVVFPLARLRVVQGVDLQGSVRLWGSGGLFGYYGWFWSRALGRTRWYVTDRDRAVVIADGDRMVVVSPDDLDGFVAAIGKGEVRVRAERTGVNPAIWIGLAGGAVGLGIAAAAMLYAPGAPPVELTRDGLVIQSRFFGMTVAAGGVDVAGVRVVDLASEPGWKPVRRTNGFGNPHYRAGSFRTANGREVKLFTTGAGRLVLLPPKGEGTPVLLETEKPDEFAARVRTAWGLLN